MALDRLLDVCARLPVMALRCSIVMAQAGELDDHAGSLFHGAFGWALRDAAPRLWSAAYGPLPQGAIRPFALLPPSSGRWQQGETLQFELSLFADLAKDPAGICAALLVMGERGLGPQRITFRLQQLIQIFPEGQQLIWTRSRPDLPLAVQPQALDQFLISAATLWSSLSYTALLAQMTCRSRLHIKEQGRVLQHAPAAITVVKTIARRLFSLTETVCEQEKLAIYESFDSLASISLAWDHSREDTFQRFSSRTRQHHQIEGVAGGWGYQGANIIQLLPWLAIGKWLHVGSKTTFGFGAIDWQLAAFR